MPSVPAHYLLTARLQGKFDLDVRNSYRMRFLALEMHYLRVYLLQDTNVEVRGHTLCVGQMSSGR